ncbi:hypothetical protein [Haloparvum sedimenti]|uniref:hypothetical protein n=1 Tax=Haloparvum sedimenti TaxID=1678448 RepID=UPI00071E9548|nr:hypothetical protein [Haloparvum sedimenti]
MDSDSPAVTSVAGQPIRRLGALFKTGNIRTFTRDWTAPFGRTHDDALGYRGESAHHRRPAGEGHAA